MLHPALGATVVNFCCGVVLPFCFLAMPLTVASVNKVNVK